MSTITLADLRADFEAALDAVWQTRGEDFMVHVPRTAEHWSKLRDNAFASRYLNSIPSSPFSKVHFHACDTARLLIVAEEEGLNAAMLWKLAN